LADKVARFVGGPLDGKSQILRVDLENIEYVDAPDGHGERIMERPDPPSRAALDAGRHFYRRSVKSADVYVYQP